MRKLIVNAYMSLDGVIQAPAAPDEDSGGGFELGGWSMTYWDIDLEEKMAELMGGDFDLLLGRRTYEILAAYWPHADEPGAEQLNSARKYVASRTLTEPSWENTTILDEDVTAEVERLKKEDGPAIQVHGSSDLLQTLLATDLVDEFRLMIFPVVLGKGKRIFGDGARPIGLKLVDSTVTSTGVTINIYRRAGDVPIGSVSLD